MIQLAKHIKALINIYNMIKMALNISIEIISRSPLILETNPKDI